MTTYKPPLIYPGLIPATLVNHRLGIAAGVLPIAAILLAIYLIQTLTQHAYINDPISINVILTLTLGFLTALPVHLIIRRLPRYPIDGYSVMAICCLFPFWLLPVAFLGGCFLAPIACTITWSIMLSVVLGKRRAIHFALLQAIPSNIAMFFAHTVVPYNAADAFYTPTLLVWHLTHPFALAITAELVRRDHEHLSYCCHFCGYPRQGLGNADPCPECGRYHMG